MRPHLNPDFTYRNSIGDYYMPGLQLYQPNHFLVFTPESTDFTITERLEALRERLHTIIDLRCSLASKQMTLRWVRRELSYELREHFKKYQDTYNYGTLI